MKLSQSKFSRLTVKSEPYPLIIKKRKRWFVQVQCDCGVVKTVNANDLKAYKIKSCGCLQRESSIKNIQDFNELVIDGDIEHPSKTHGDSDNPLYVVWRGMKARCNNPQNHKYPSYGGRGIKIKWKSYQDFKKDMAKSYQEAKEKYGKTYIDRIDNNGHYSKSNCRWSSAREQANNTRRNRRIRFRGKNLTVTQWSRELGIPRSTINSRIHVLKLKKPSDILRKP